MMGLVIHEVGVQICRILRRSGDRKAWEIGKKNRRTLQLAVVLRGIEQVCQRGLAELVLIEDVENSIFACTNHQAEFLDHYGPSRTQILISPIIAAVVGLVVFTPI